MDIGIILSKRSKRALGAENYLEDMTSEEHEEESEPKEIRRIPQRKNKLPDNNTYNGIEMKRNQKKRKFTINTGSPVTIMPNYPALFATKNIKPMKERYQYVNKKEIKFLEKKWVGEKLKHKTSWYNTPSLSKLVQTIIHHHQQSFTG